MAIINSAGVENCILESVETYARKRDRKVNCIAATRCIVHTDMFNYKQQHTSSSKLKPNNFYNSDTEFTIIEIYVRNDLDTTVKINFKCFKHGKEIQDLLR